MCKCRYKTLETFQTSRVESTADIPQGLFGLECNDILQLSKAVWSTELNQKFCKSAALSGLFWSLLGFQLGQDYIATEKKLNYIGFISSRKCISVHSFNVQDKSIY